MTEQKASTQQQFGKMAGSVLNRIFGLLINISAKLKVSASKSATSPSCKTLCVTLKPTAHLAHLVFADTKANPKKTKRAKSSTAE